MGRRAMQYILGLGGNLGDPQETFRQALEQIEGEIGEITRRSPWFWTKPLLHPVTPVPGQQPHLNAVIAVESSLAPLAVLEALLRIEERLGRVRAIEEVPWGPRVIDLDLIAAEDLEIRSERLTVPHPEMARRDFVLVPMLFVCPEWRHPQLGLTVSELERSVETRFILSQVGDEQAAHC